MDLATNLLVYYRMEGAKSVAEVAFIFNLGVLNYRKLQCDSLGYIIRGLLIYRQGISTILYWGFTTMFLMLLKW